ncbi:MAG: thiazole synthase [Bacteroidetes bacterium]|nr:MAG: thiazole synthase [Bacteroidota bacterium]
MQDKNIDRLIKPDYSQPVAGIDGDFWHLGPLKLRSRLLVGTSGFPNPLTMMEAFTASASQMVTVAIRRINLKDRSEESLLSMLSKAPVHILPNTAGCYTAKEAILVAELAREALETDFIKLEVIGDDETLLPDSEELLKAARELVSAGFIVMAYTNDDPIVCKKLASLGCAAVMPLASPIGSGMGLVNPYNLELIRDQISECSLVVDAGIGTASDAALAMELGYDGVLVNSAISGAKHPMKMAAAMRNAVLAGRFAFTAGRIPRRFYARASSPLEGRVGSVTQEN